MRIGWRHSVIGCLLSSLSALGCSAEGSTCGPNTGVVSRVIDGDTIELESGEHIRYLLVDTPELSSDECFATEAHELNRDLVKGQTVELEYDERCTDDYNRLLAYVSVSGREVNRVLLERGYACVLYIPPNGTDRRDEYELLEATARMLDRGLWSACSSTPC